MNTVNISGGPSNAILASVDCDESRISGCGGEHYPRLRVPLRLEFQRSAQPNVDRLFSGFAASLRAGGLDKVADALPTQLRYLQRGTWDHGNARELSLEFHLDGIRISKLEESRNGGDLKLELELSFCADWWERIKPKGGEDYQQECRTGDPELLKANFTLSIPSSAWVEKVLPNVGYGQTHWISFPAVSLDSCEVLKNSFLALKQAEEKHRLGFYDDAVGKCRLALEKFFEHVRVNPEREDSKTVPKLKASWEKKLGQATYNWLNDALGAVKLASNRAHHSPMPHFDIFESQMVLGITAALVSYVARADLMEKE